MQALRDDYLNAYRSILKRRRWHAATPASAADLVKSMRIKAWQVLKHALAG